MCDPQSIAKLGLVMDAGAGVGNTVAVYTDAAGKSRSAEYNAVVNENNAQLADWQAKDAILRGGIEETNLRRAAAKIKGTQTAALAAGNVDTSSGSALDILEQTSRMTEEDAATIRSNAQREAYGYKVTGENSRTKARFERANASSPLLATTGSLLTNASRVGDNWNKYKEKYGNSKD